MQYCCTIYLRWLGKLINSYTGSVNAFVAQYNPFIYKSYCNDPRYPYDNTVRAGSIIFENNIGAYYGYDYYDYWGRISFVKVVEFLKKGG